MSNILLIANNKTQDITSAANSLENWLQSQGHGVFVEKLADISESRNIYDIPDISQTPKPRNVLAASAEIDMGKIDLAVSLGGDGVILRAMKAVSASGVPVLGINYGQMGYLAEVEPDEAQAAIKSFFEGKCEIQERMQLRATYIVGDNDIEDDNDSVNEKHIKHIGNALNEIHLGKILSGHTIRLKMELNAEHFITYEADGLIISTPTGSTAYSFSAGGPVVEPNLKTIIITPVAPHMIFDRPLVIDAKSELKIIVQGDYSAEFNMDGYSFGALQPSGAIHITQALEPARLVIYKGQDFQGVLKSKFGLKDR